MTANSKFKIGDKVIAVKDTPQLPEGWVGYIASTDSSFGYHAEETYGSDEFFAFKEHELELLSPSVRIPHGPDRDDITPQDIQGISKPEHTGGSVNYYKVHVANPTTLPEAYDAEANDIIESLGLTFAEGNLFKAIWRMAADRNGKKKKGNTSVYDAEKLVFFAERVLVQEKAKGETN